MNKQKISQAVTIGLIAGYGGKTEFTKINRGGFSLSVSHLQKDNLTYHDEWTNNGGQEITKIDQELFTRVYAGGVASSETLSRLNIAEEDVIKNLISRISKLGDKTRLFENFTADPKDNWGYEYKILDNNNDIQVTTGKETITYKNEIVFIHVFVLSPIK